jgi:hypothetical protein
MLILVGKVLFVAISVAVAVFSLGVGLRIGDATGRILFGSPKGK